MELKSEEFFNEMKFRFFRYASSVETIAEVTLILLSILPVLLVMSSFLVAQDSLMHVIGLSFVAIPLITSAIILVTGSTQPKNHDMVRFAWHPLAAGVAAGLVGFALVGEAWLGLALMALVSAATSFAFVSRQFAEISMVESALASFFRDITEYRKIGISIPSAIIRISKERTYNKFFDGIMFEMSSRLTYGMKLQTIIDSLTIRSWRARVSFFILSKIAESGGGTPQILEQVTNFSTKVTQAKSEMISRVKVFAFLAYASPLLIVWSSQAMSKLLEKITPEYALLTNGIVADLSAPDELLQAVNLLMVVSSICIGIIMAKITYLTAKHTLTVAITSAVAIVSVYVVPFLPSL